MIIYIKNSFHLIFRIKKSWLFSTIIFRVLNGMLPLIDLWILKNLINEVSLFITSNNSESIFLILKLIILQLLISIFKSGITNFMNVMDTKMEQTLDYYLGKNILQKLYSVPYSYFELPTFYNHQFRLRNNYGSKFLRPIKNVLEALQNTISILSFISYLLFAHWLLVIMALIVAVPTFIIQYKFGHSKFNLFKNQSSKLREASYISRLFSDKQSTKEIRLFNLGDLFLNKWSEIILNNNNLLLKILNKQRNANTVLDSLSAFLYALSAILTIYIIFLKKLSIGSFVTIIQSMKQLQYSINHMSYLIAIILESTLYVKDYFDFVNFKDKNLDQEGFLKMRLKHPLEKSSKNITIKNLFYRYPISESYTLKDISLNIKENEKIAIVGDNGSGKSTLIKILAGLYQPTRGEIYFGEKEIREIEVTDLRKNITVIFQDFVKFSYSVQENIVFSNVNESDNEMKIKKVAKETGLDKLVKKLPRGFDTNLGKIFSDSVDISGGEWQKIALSRALFKNSSIIILDEPTASLDPESELYIFNKFIELVKERTAVFISHRMASAKMADRIIVMKNGEIVECGNHGELIKKKGVYFTMYESQATWYQ
jgi:ATP-binding cassette, subfamily B, bacterial